MSSLAANTLRKLVTVLFASMLCVSGLLTSTVLALTPATPALASSTVDVYVGYADTARSNPANFPTPWEGSPGVIYEGCSPSSSCEFDAGAARVVNNTGGAVTVNSITISFGPCLFDMWSKNVSLPAGDQIIITQTASGTGNGCASGTTTSGTMDSSDFGPNGADWSTICSQSGVIPQVNVTVNGTTTSYTDSSQVLNTGGVDQASCNSSRGPQGNESAQWTKIGTTQVCSGASLTLAPPSQTAYVGGNATLNATLTNSCNQPLQGASVDFKAVAGPNSGGSGSEAADSSGAAPFSYSSAVTGTDTFQASVTNPAGTFYSNEVTVSWVADATLPTCALSGVIKNAAGQTTAIQIAVQDSDGGLASIAVTELANATADVGTYQTGISSAPTTVTITDKTTGVVTVTANKINLSSGASIALTAKDVGGNSVSCDPIAISTVRADGKPVTQQVAGVGQADSTLTIINDATSADNVTVDVNGHTYQVSGLKAGQRTSLNISSALTSGANSVSVTLAGKPGSSAAVLFGNI